MLNFRTVLPQLQNSHRDHRADESTKYHRILASGIGILNNRNSALKTKLKDKENLNRNNIAIEYIHPGSQYRMHSIPKK